MNEGWIKLHTKFIRSAIFESGDSYLVQLAMYCMIEANWKDKDVVIGNEVVHLKRGQFITGRKSIVKALTKLKAENSPMFKKMEFLYRRKLFLLVNLDFLHIKPTNKYTVITVKNYNRYQDNAQQMHNNDTTDAQQMHTTKEYKNIRSKEDIDKSIGDKSPDKKDLRNQDIDWILGEFKKATGRIPADRKPRQVAYNIIQLTGTFIKLNGSIFLALRGEELTSKYVIEKFFMNLKQKQYVAEIEKLETAKLKYKVYLDGVADKLQLEKKRKEENYVSETTN